MKPKAQTVDGLLLLRYSLPQRIYTSGVYPVSAPNGSTILVYGHEHGLLVLWRGGRPLRSASKDEGKGKGKGDTANGVSHENSMDLDVAEGEEHSDFEEEEEEVDSARPYQSIIQQLNLHLGTAVLHLSFPKLPHLSLQARDQLTPEMLQERLVVAVACADCTVRVLTLPLTPPSPESKVRPEFEEDATLSYAGRGSWDEQLITIPHDLGHRSLPKGVSIAFAPRDAMSSTEEDPDNDEEEEDDSISEDWDLIVASHSADLNGLLLVHRITVTEGGFWLEDDPADSNLLWRKQYLTSPAISMDLHVSTHSDEPRYPRILLAETYGAVRIFDTSTPTTPSSGSWALSLYPPRHDTPEAIPHHNRLISTAWIFSGKAIAILSAEGEWGIWNLSYSPSSTSSKEKKSLLITGAIPTPFTLSGWVIGSTPTSTTRSSNPSTSRDPKTASSLAPLTPGTRRIRQEALFTGSTDPSGFSTVGGIGVYNIGKVYGGKEDDESLVFWHGDDICVIASLQAYWRNKIKGSGNLFGAGAGGQLRNVATVRLPGQRCTAVEMFPVVEEEAGAGEGREAKVPEFLVSGERGFVVVTRPLSARKVPRGVGKAKRTVGEDQTLLEHGELDVEGMERMLEGMANGGRDGGRKVTNGVGGKRKVLFANSS